MKWLVIGITIGFLVGFLYHSVDLSLIKSPERLEGVVTKVVDGDTLVVSGGFNVRLLGIDTDERGYECYELAKKRLEGLVLGKTVEIESDRDDKDQYGRLLRHIFIDGDHVNLRMVSEGYAVARFFPRNTKYKDEITTAEKLAFENKVGCKWR